MTPRPIRPRSKPWRSIPHAPCSCDGTQTAAGPRSRQLELVADRKRAGFGSWYELFPRSAAPAAETAWQLSRRRGAVALCGRDGFRRAVLSADPADRARQPQGREQRTAGAVPEMWAARGRSARPRAATRKCCLKLGTSGGFPAPDRRARTFGIEIALDLAFQCAPDHPYVSEHPQWFKRRPDGSVQYAENPPKKYQDIYPFDFESDDWRALWEELKSVVEFWIAQGVMIFRVDNPHTKPFAFWEWLITEVKARQSRGHLPCRGVYAAEGHAPPGEAGVHPVVHLLHVAQYQAGAHGVLHRAGARPRPPIFPPERLAQHARHPA